eukprot:3453959-Amphidinium_carterae.1
MQSFIDEEPDYCCLGCNQDFTMTEASVLRGECMCGGVIEWRYANRGKGSRGSTSGHDLSVDRAAARLSLAPICEKAL